MLGSDALRLMKLNVTVYCNAYKDGVPIILFFKVKGKKIYWSDGEYSFDASKGITEKEFLANHSNTVFDVPDEEVII